MDDASRITASAAPRRAQDAARLALDWLPLAVLLTMVLVLAAAELTGFSASLSALWEAGPSGPSKVLAAIDNRRLSPSAIVDFDGNGSSLLLGPDGPLQMRSVLRAGSYERAFLSDVPYFAGPC